MVIEEYLRMRIQSAESILAGERLAGNVPKAMAEEAAIAELRGVEAFLNNASEKGEAELPASDNTDYTKCSEAIMRNISDRRGYDLYSCDADIIKDIRSSIANIIAEHFA